MGRRSTTEKLVDETANIEAFAPIVILRLRNMTAIDATGTHAIETFAKRLTDSGRTLLLCGAMQQPRQLSQAEQQRDLQDDDHCLAKGKIVKAKSVSINGLDLR